MMEPRDPVSDRRYLDWGGLIFGLLIVAIGGYLLLKDTFKIDVPDITGEMIWPVILMAIGAVVLIRSLTGDTRHARRRDR